MQELYSTKFSYDRIYAALPTSAKFCVYNAMGHWTTMLGLINYAWGGWEN